MMDLHAHSLYSDGSSTAAEIVRIAKERELSLCAITDHDCIDGVEEAIREGQKIAMPVLSGIELDIENECELHLLGYGFDYHNPALLAELKHQANERQARNEKIVEQLEALDIPIEVRRDTRGKLVSRTHLADAIVRAGKADNIQDAFAKYLGPTGLVRIERKRLRMEEAIQLIHQAGGLAVLAHPGFIKLHPKETIAELIEAGLDGIEAYYAMHSASQIVDFCDIAEANNLMITTGSDYHGEFRKYARFGHVAKLAALDSRIREAEEQLLSMMKIQIKTMSLCSEKGA